MKPNVIELFPDGRIGAYEMPLKPSLMDSPKRVYMKQVEYDEKVEAAKRGAVYFRIEDDYPILPQKYGMLVIGKPYPVPDGYEVKICVNPDVIGKDAQYAILVKSDSNG